MKFIKKSIVILLAILLASCMTIMAAREKVERENAALIVGGVDHAFPYILLDIKTSEVGISTELSTPRYRYNNFVLVEPGTKRLYVRKSYGPTAPLGQITLFSCLAELVGEFEGGREYHVGSLELRDAESLVIYDISSGNIVASGKCPGDT